jgi:N-acetylmuramic acid 6-phosphate etherase
VLTEADGDLRVALVSLLAGVPVTRAHSALETAGGQVRTALTALDATPTGRGHPRSTSRKEAR